MEVLDLACRLKAEVIDSDQPKRSTSFLIRAAYSLSKPLGLALLVWKGKRDLDLLYMGNEKIGILVATLFKLHRRRPRIVIANHYLSNPKKALLFRLLRLQSAVDALICLNGYQAAFVEKELGVASQKVYRIHYGACVDGAFFSPCINGARSNNYLLSVGRESRDYPTLFEALRSTEVQAKVVSSGLRDPQEYPDHIAFRAPEGVELFEHVSYIELKNLYAGCSFVVVPMRGVDYPAGITAVMEAMAMGKPVIATYSRGIEEFIKDGETGFWTEPGDTVKLRQKILLLWNNPDLSKEMGRRARESVKRRVDMDRFVEELESVIESVHADTPS